MLIEFCLPIFNEEKILEENALRLLDFCQNKNFSFAWKIVFVVNGSTDGSLAICRKLAAISPENLKIFIEKEKGKGLAIRKYWSASNADILVFMDADLATSLENIPDLLKPLLSGESDLAVGSRLLAKSKIERPLNREIVSQTYNLLSRIILGHKFSDMQCGFKAIKKDSFMKIAPLLESNKWFFDTELIVMSKFMGLRIKEIPVIWEEHRYEKSKSKVNVLKDGLIFLADLFVLRRRIKGLNLKK
jgi:glycosyltransferase involved in cell wall biosynthesis